MEHGSTLASLKAFVQRHKSAERTIGLVPTMGYLHEGHFSLIHQCRQENDVVIVSIFVNPTQFGANEDLDSYPKSLAADLDHCKMMGADFVFHPDANTMYQEHKTYINVEEISEQLCGKSRPTHFRGVCTVVAKLFNLTKANRAYFGEKDAQQVVVIKKMVEDLNFDIEIVTCPIVRENDGLAMSSRNKYLNEEQREQALCLYHAISKAKSSIKKGMQAQEIIDMMKGEIKRAKGEIDYIEIVDPKELKPVELIEQGVLIALAVKIGPARLLDNFIF